MNVILWLFGLYCFSYDVNAQSTTRMEPPYASDKPLSEPTIFADGVISTGDFDSHIYQIDINTLNIGK